MDKSTVVLEEIRHLKTVLLQDVDDLVKRGDNVDEMDRSADELQQDAGFLKRKSAPAKRSLTRQQISRIIIIVLLGLCLCILLTSRPTFSMVLFVVLTVGSLLFVLITLARQTAIDQANEPNTTVLPPHSNNKSSV